MQCIGDTIRDFLNYLISKFGQFVGVNVTMFELRNYLYFPNSYLELAGTGNCTDQPHHQVCPAAARPGHLDLPMADGIPMPVRTWSWQYLMAVGILPLIRSFLQEPVLVARSSSW